MGWREEVLERDNHECQLGKLFGVAEISGVPCSEDVQVHHITYKRYGYEVLEDGITVCVRCHDVLTDVIRSLRYSKDAPTTEDVKGIKPGIVGEAKKSREVPATEDVKNVKPRIEEEAKDEETEIQDYWDNTVVDAQRQARRPLGYHDSQDKRDFFEAEEG